MAELTLEAKIEEAFRQVIAGTVDVALSGVPNLVSLVSDELAIDHVCSIVRSLDPCGFDGVNRTGHWSAQCEVKVVTDLSGREDSPGVAVVLRTTHQARCAAVRNMIYVLGLDNLLSATQTGLDVSGFMLGTIQHQQIGNSWVTRHEIVLKYCGETDL